MALTAKLITKINEPGRYGDGRGLYLQVTPVGVRSWVLRYERGGRERMMGLGPLADFNLDQARERASNARRLLKDGIDPLDARKAERAKLATEANTAAAKNVTFKDCAERYFKFHSPKWTNAKHAGQFLSSLSTHAFPVMGRLPVAAIEKEHVLRAIEPIWHSTTATASRVRGRIEAVLDFAKVSGWRAGENPAAWDGNLKHLLPAPGAIAKVMHHAALPFAELPAFMEQLATRGGMSARALEFLILTASRTGEVIGARWSEIDLEAKLWAIPAERMKGGREHRVPLSERAIALLRALPREADPVFPGPHKGTAIGKMAMSRLFERMRRRNITVHGFRSAFRDWAAERTNYANHVVEMALAHAIGDKVEAAYRRGDLFVKRTRLMADWARYCSTPQRDADATVTPIRARKV
jgi:integrase